MPRTVHRAAQPIVYWLDLLRSLPTIRRMAAIDSPHPVDLEEFVLDFVHLKNSEVNTSDLDQDVDEEENEYDRYAELERMQDMIPADAIEIGTFEDEVENFTSWEISNHYYVIPWKGKDFDWALFRISWDDNWGRYDWDACARVAGVVEGRTAAKLMLQALFEKWGYDLESDDHKAYRDFIERI
jgi:hypothetical protein